MNIRSFPNDRQLDKMDCGPACLKMIAKFYGKFYSLQFVRDKCGVTKEGVSFLDLSHAAENIGLRTISFKCSFEDLVLKVPLPVIIHWNNSHFVVVYKIKQKNKIDDSTIYVSDPAKGLIRYSGKEFISKWYKSDEKMGLLIALEPQADFYQREADEKLERKKTPPIFWHILNPIKKAS